MSDFDIIDQFRKAMLDKGIDISSDIIADGKIHRYHVRDDKKGTRNAWAVLHLDGKASGAFGCKKRYGDEKFKWSSKLTVTMSPDERAAMRQKVERQKAERAAEEKAKFEAAAVRANKIWDAAQEATDHPYLTRKGIKSHGLRIGTWEVFNEEGEIFVVSKRALLVPIRDAAKRIHSLQAIFPDDKNRIHRDKDFLKSGAKSGLFYTIGKPINKTIIICEGYATASSLHECTGHAVVVAFDAGNLMPVAQVVRQRFADFLIVIAADNDRWTEKPIPNPGVYRATEATKAVRGVLAVPDFQNLDGQPTDFNDLHKREGAEAVRLAIERAINPPAEPEPEPEKPDNTEDQPELPETEAEPIPSKNFTVLGYDHGTYYIFVHEKKQILDWTKGDFTEAGLIEIADINWWELNFPGEKGGFNRKAAMNWIVRVAHKRGIYDIERIRGRGAWVDKGRFIFHHGDHLSVDGVKTDITEIQSYYVYELAKSLPDPADTPLSDAEGERLLEIAQMFRWTKPASAALLTGWVALAPLCGALKWRPHIWLTGGSGSGKSTLLNDFVHRLIQGIDIYAQGSSSEAGIRQTLRADARPVLFDESEKNNEREKNRMDGVIALIRQASTESQAKTLKGTAGGEAMQFHIRSMFCLSSIQVGLSNQADIERMSILALKPKRDDPNAGETWKKISDALALIDRDETISNRLFKRCIDLLPIIRQNIAVFVEVAANRFGTQREGDQYGTLLAGAWSLKSANPVTKAEAEALIDSYDWSEHVENNDMSEADRALSALMEAHIRLQGGGEVTVFELIKRSLNYPVDGMDVTSDVAEAVLQRHGMKLERPSTLLLSNTSVSLKNLLSGTVYESDLRGYLLRLKDVTRYDNKTVKFNGVPSKCIALPLKNIFDDNSDYVPF